MNKLIEIFVAFRKAFEVVLPTMPVEDSDALVMKCLYPNWVPNHHYEANTKFRHEGKLYQTRQPVDSLAHYPPGSQGVEALYKVIDETHAGTQADPIPYSGNMELTEGKYYAQDGVVYLCINSSINPVYERLAYLAVYVKAIE